MAIGGVFQLIANDGAQDQLLMATELLNKRLKEIQRIRCKNPAIRDPTPTLVDIERTHVLFVNSHFKPFVAVGYEYNKIGVQEGIIRLGGNITFSIPQFGDFFADMCLHITLENLYTTPGNQVRYCDFLGHRLLQLTQFQVNGNFLDQYSSETYNFHYNFCVAPSKKLSYLRCIGQETPTPAYLTQQVGIDEYREMKMMLNGPQTPKQIHPVVDLWIPLLFWFNLDPRLAIPSVSIPYGQRFIQVTLATADQIAQGTPAAIFTPPTVSVAELYINNIFVNPEIHDIFIKRIGFALIRVHLETDFPLNTPTTALQLNQLKYPIETIYFGCRPTTNDTTMEDWYKLHFVTPTFVNYPVSVPNMVPFPPHVLAFSNAVWRQATPTLDTITIEVHAIQLYNETPTIFFNQYIPLTFGGPNMTSPEDIGAYMVVFNLYPGAYQPSGHINLSRTREFYLTYTSSIIGGAVITNATMIIVAVAINFLLISDGSAALRYNV
jgi:hypothetical protein